MWVPVPPSAEASLAGATVLANLSGSPITVARAEDRRLLVRSASARCNAAYVFSAAGQGESTTDLSWDGQTMVYESGELMAEGPRFPEGPVCTIADIDLGRLRQDRLRQGTHDDNRRTHDERVAAFRTIEFELDAPTGDVGLRRKVDRFPFVPDDPERLALDCYEAYNIQVSGLEQRLTAIGQPKAIIGVSGGLDSTQALIVTAKAMDRLGRPRSDIHAFTMPGFATGETTKSYATRLAKSLGVTFEELDIRPAAKQMLDDIDHPFADGEPVYDVTFENVQAGLRYDYLFRLANHRGGIVVGTGDLSELALGWCTYGVGDQMSHYNVNAGVPKTLVQHLIRWVAETDQFDAETNELLEEILAAGDHSRADPHHRGRRSRRPPRTPSVPTRSRTSRSSASSAAATGPPRSRSWPGTPGTTSRRGSGRRASRTSGVRRTTSPRSVSGWRSSSSGSSPASSSAPRCPTAPRSAPAAPCPPAATGGCRPTPTPPPGWPSWRTCPARPDRLDGPAPAEGLLAAREPDPPAVVVDVAGKRGPHDTARSGVVGSVSP